MSKTSDVNIGDHRSTVVTVPRGTAQRCTDRGDGQQCSRHRHRGKRAERQGNDGDEGDHTDDDVVHRSAPNSTSASRGKSVRSDHCTVFQS